MTSARRRSAGVSGGSAWQDGLWTGCDDMFVGEVDREFEVDDPGKLPETASARAFPPGHP